MPIPSRDEEQKLAFFQRLGRILEHRWFVPAVALLGLVVRLALLYRIAGPRFAFYDESDYDAIAVSFLKTHRYMLYGASTAYRPPGEPFFIAGVYAVLGQNPHIVEFLEAVLLVAVPFLCARLGRTLGLSVLTANVGALLASLHPGLAYAATTLYPTALTSVALTAGLLYSSVAARSDSKAASVKGGLALGVTGSLTTIFVPLPLLAAGYCIWKRKMRAATIIGIVGMAPAILWVVRNDRVLGEYTLATNGGFNLFLGANDLATPRSGNWIIQPPFDPSLKLVDELAVDQMWQKRAKDWIRGHPIRYAWLSVARGVLVVDSVGRPKTPGVHSGLAEKLVGWAMLPIVLLSIIGLAMERRKPASFLTAAAFLLIAVSSAFTLVKPRFRFPLDPVLDVFAVAAVAGMRHSTSKSGVLSGRVSGSLSGHETAT